MIFAVLINILVIECKTETATPSKVKNSKSPTPTLSPTFFGPSQTSAPSPSPSTVPVNEDSQTLVVKLICEKEDTTCCDDFPNIWASFVNVNDPTLVSVSGCVADKDGVLTVTYDQLGTNFHTTTEIVDDYWNLAGCQNEDPFSDGPCFPVTNNLNSQDWSDVFSLQIENDYYVAVTVTKTASRSFSPSPSKSAKVQDEGNNQTLLTPFVALSMLLIVLLF